MNDTNYTATITLEQSPKEVFAAINDVRGWWSQDIEGSTAHVGDVFTYRYEDIHICNIEVTDSVPGERVTWYVLDNYFNFTEDKNEWKGTEMIFEVFETDGNTELRFTHKGLVPEYECFEVCTDAWSNYIKGSLRRLIATGEGQPNHKADAHEA